MLATHDAGGGELGTAMLLVAVAFFVVMLGVFVMLARETRRRRQKETAPEGDAAVAVPE